MLIKILQTVTILLIKLLILFIKAVTILFIAVEADDLKQQKSFYKRERVR